MDCLKRKLAGDPDVGWAAWGMLRLSEEAVEALVQAAREEEDRAWCEVRKARSDSFHKWASAETKGSTKQLCRWIREGSSLPGEFGLFTEDDGRVLAGEAGLIRAVDKAWWPLWKPGVDRRTRPARFERLGGGRAPASHRWHVALSLSGNWPGQGSR